jgi:uncharacterized protein (DUF3084 family)
LLRSLLISLSFLAIIFCQASLCIADTTTPDEFEKWDNELNQSWGALEKVNTEIEGATAPSVSETASTEKRKVTPTVTPAKTAKPLAYEAESIDSRQVSDLQARIDRLEGRVKQLERTDGSLQDQIRNLDRTVNDLRRKI